MIDQPLTPYASSPRSCTPPSDDLIDSSEASSEHSFDWIQKSGKKPIFGSGQQVGAGIAAQSAGAQATANAELSIRGFQEEGKRVPRLGSKLRPAFAPRSPADSFHQGADTSAGKPCSEWRAEWQAAERERLIGRDPPSLPLQPLRKFDA